MADYDAASVLNPRALPPLVREQSSGLTDSGIDNPAQFMLDKGAQMDLYNRAKRALTTQYPFLENDPSFNSDLSGAFNEFLNKGVQRSVDPNEEWKNTVMPVLSDWQMKAARQYQSGQSQTQAGYEGLVGKIGAGAALQAYPSILSTPMHSRALESVDQERNNNARFGATGNRELSNWIDYKKSMIQEYVKARANILPGMKVDKDTADSITMIMNEVKAADAKIKQLAGQASSPSTSATESAGSSLSSAPPLPSFDTTPTRYGQVYGDKGQFINTNPTKLSHGQSIHISGMGTPNIDLSGDSPTSTAANDLGQTLPTLTESYQDIPSSESVPAPVKKAKREAAKTIANSGILGMIPNLSNAALDLGVQAGTDARAGKYGVLPQIATAGLTDEAVHQIGSAADALTGVADLPAVGKELLFGTPEDALPMPVKSSTAGAVNKIATQSDFDKLQSGDLYLNPADGKVYTKK